MKLPMLAAGAATEMIQALFTWRRARRARRRRHRRGPAPIVYALIWRSL